MNILLIGSGGREHALAWAIAKSPLTSTLFCAPGNAGIAQEAEIVSLDVNDAQAVINFCNLQAIKLVVVGPEAPLVAGLADELRAAGIKTFGPSAAAARLEGSKGFTKDICAKYDIPTGAYGRFSTEADALVYLASHPAPIVVKADGLAAGKGVTVAMTDGEAEAAVKDIFAGKFGAAGAECVIEEYLDGEEASFFALCDGKTAVAFGTAQDHKRVGEGDVGPNTGGMGAYTPAPVLTAELQDRAMREIVEPTARAMAAEGHPFTGVLFAGLMLTADGPKLIEYNVRFGDPECEAIMPRIEGDFAALLMAVAAGEPFDAPALSADHVMTVILAAEGYPGTPKGGGAIRQVDEAETEGVIVFHAGTRRDGDSLVASGGRVLAVTARGSTLAAARDAAYKAVGTIDFTDGFCRRDIGWRELERQA